MIPCAVLAALVHPSTSHIFINRFFWGFCVYLESVSVLPQLRVMQNTKVTVKMLKISLFPLVFDIDLTAISFWFQIVEPFTAHYVFALGVARFLSCAHWVLQVCAWL